MQNYHAAHNQRFPLPLGTLGSTAEGWSPEWPYLLYYILPYMSRRRCMTPRRRCRPETVLYSDAPPTVWPTTVREFPWRPIFARATAWVGKPKDRSGATISYALTSAAVQLYITPITWALPGPTTVTHGIESSLPSNRRAVFGINRGATIAQIRDGNQQYAGRGRVSVRHADDFAIPLHASGGLPVHKVKHMKHECARQYSRPSLFLRKNHNGIAGTESALVPAPETSTRRPHVAAIPAASMQCFATAAYSFSPTRSTPACGKVARLYGRRRTVGNVY